MERAGEPTGPAVIAVVPARDKHLGVTPRWFVAFLYLRVSGPGVTIEQEARRQPDIVGDEIYALRLKAYRVNYPNSKIQVLEDPAADWDSAFAV